MSAAPLAYYFFFTPAAGLIALGLVTGAPTLEAAALTQTHTLTANGLVVGAPVLGETGVNPGLSADGLVTGSPRLDSPALSQAYSIGGAGLVTGAPVLDSAPLEGQLIANGLTATPQLDQPGLSQSHSLTGTGLVAGTPTLDTPELTQDTPSAEGLVTGAPVLGTPGITQQQTLTALGLVTGAPILDAASQKSGIPFVCAPDILIKKELDGSEISPSADLRLKITLTRDEADVDPHTNLANDYTDCTATFQIYKCGNTTAIATLTLDEGIDRATNNADSQVFTVLWPQASVVQYRGKKDLHYRFTVTTNDDEIISGDDSKPGYTGIFSIARV